MSVAVDSLYDRETNKKLKKKKINKIKNTIYIKLLRITDVSGHITY